MIGRSIKNDVMERSPVCQVCLKDVFLVIPQPVWRQRLTLRNGVDKATNTAGGQSVSVIPQEHYSPKWFEDANKHQGASVCRGASVLSGAGGTLLECHIHEIISKDCMQ